MAAIGFGNPYADNRLKNLYFNTPAPKSLGSITAPKRGLGQIVSDAVSGKLAPVVGKRMAQKAAALLDYTPVAAGTSAFDLGHDVRQGDWLSALGNGITTALNALPDGGAILGAKGGAMLHSIIAPLFHGSPRKFEKFSLDHIGTGEGNQAYGRGLYFAENPAVASTYAIPRGAEMQDVPNPIRNRLKAALGSQDYLGFDTFGQAINAVRAHRLDFDKRWEVDNADEIRKALSAYDDHRFLPSDRPTLYEARLNANPQDFADWDQLGPRAERVAREGRMAGVRYLDNHSRYGLTGDPTRNYVVFDPSIIDVLNRH